MTNLLSIDNLCAYYETPTAPIRAVDNVSLEVKKGEVLGIAGESGCGKSTLALAMLRLLKPPGYIENGEVIFNGTDLLKLEEEALREIRWRQISYIPQSSMNALNPIMRIGDQIAYCVKTHEKQLDSSKIESMVTDLLVNVGLAPEVARMYPCELSGGMRQRAIIASAMALNPSLIIADEPTTALDVVVQKGIVQLLKKVREKTSSSMIIITHDMSIQSEIADRVAIMYAGKIIEIGDVRGLFGDPKHPYTKALISAIPSVKGKKKLLSIPGFPPDLRNPPPGCRFQPRCSQAKREECGTTEPGLIELQLERLVACHLYGGGG